ncbi:MAG: MerR family transcriptional regulator [Candidatus Gastranaerophilales bacterium]|nr:MerR family transcriptional regulator [Candidatus Gastranaerophilales bacterium]
MNNKPLYPISVLANLLNIHQRTLRIYDEQKILVPARTLKNRRLYSQNDIEKAKLILYFTKNLALNLSGIKIVFGLLEEFEIKPSDYFELINKIANKKDIDEILNLEKTAKRGRKSKNKINLRR